MAATPDLPSSPSRRDFVGGVAALAAASTPAWGQTPSGAEDVPAVPVRLTINGKEQALTLDPRTTLLDALRENLHLTGTKKGCDHGQCGACTILVNGRSINACLALALAHEGDQIITIEGLSQGENLHPMQAAFLEHDGYQCGYCTPGQICAAVSVVYEASKGIPSAVTKDLARGGAIELTGEEVRERMSGNICRCGAYPNIVDAVQAAATPGRRA